MTARNLPFLMGRLAQPSWAWAVVPASAFLLIFFVVPLGFVLKQSLFSPEFTLRNYIVALESPVYLRILYITILIALQTSLICLLLGYPVAYLLSHVKGSISIYIVGLVLVPFWVSVLIRSYSLVIILRDNGIVNNILINYRIIHEPLHLVYNRIGVIIGMVYALLPYMIITIFGIISRIDGRLVPAARSLGASGFYAFRKVYLPLSMPGISAGLMLVFVQAIGYYVTPALLGGARTPTMAMVIGSQVLESLNWGLASALTVILLATVVVVIALGLKWVDAEALGLPAKSRRPVVDVVQGPNDEADNLRAGVALPRSNAMESAAASLLDSGDILRAGHRNRPGKVYGKPRKKMANAGVWGVSSVVLAFLLLPVVIIVLMSFDNSSFLRFPPRDFGLRWYREFFYGQSWISATLLSVKVAITVTVVSLVLGTLAAIGLNRSQFRGKALVSILVVSPMIVPVIVTALSLYLSFLKLKLVGTFVALVLGHTILALPLVVLLVSAGLRRFDNRLEQAAITLGASRLYAWRRVLLPGIAPSLTAAGLFAFLTSFDEVVIAIFVSGAFTPTLPKQIWDRVTLDLDPTISAVATILVAVAGIIVVTAAHYQNRVAKLPAQTE